MTYMYKAISSTVGTTVFSSTTFFGRYINLYIKILSVCECVSNGSGSLGFGLDW